MVTTNMQLSVETQVNESKPLAGKVAIVTGGSRGIGAAIAKELARQGAAVAISFVQGKEKSDEVIKAIEEDGGTSIAFQSDVSNSADVQRFVETVKDQYGKIDILVNNAGITRDRTFRKLSQEEWHEVIDTNLNSVFYTTSAVINHMLDQKHGRIINISSIIGQAGGFGQSNYAASKAGMVGFTKSLALETAQNGITVNAICPGFIETEMVAQMPEKVLDGIVSKVPMKRLGKTEEIAETVAFLAKADYITGQSINVNGGLYM